MMPVNCSTKALSVSTKSVRGFRFCFPSLPSGSDGVVGVGGSETIDVVSALRSGEDRIITMRQIQR